MIMHFFVSKVCSPTDVAKNHLGMIPRAIEEIFHLLENRNITEYSLTVCYFEIYNEELRDLLDKDEKTMVLRDDIDGNTSERVNQA